MSTGSGCGAGHFSSPGMKWLVSIPSRWRRTFFTGGNFPPLLSALGPALMKTISECPAMWKLQSPIPSICFRGFSRKPPPFILCKGLHKTRRVFGHADADMKIRITRKIIVFLWPHRNVSAFNFVQGLQVAGQKFCHARFVCENFRSIPSLFPVAFTGHCGRKHQNTFCAIGTPLPVCLRVGFQFGGPFNDRDKNTWFHFGTEHFENQLK